MASARHSRSSAPPMKKIPTWNEAAEEEKVEEEKDEVLLSPRREYLSTNKPTEQGALAWKLALTSQIIEALQLLFPWIVLSWKGRMMRGTNLSRAILQIEWCMVL